MRQLNNKQFDTIQGASAIHGEIVSSQFSPLECQKDEKMRQDIIDSINRMDNDSLIDVAFTFDFLTQKEKDTYLATGQNTFKKAKKTYIKQRALADEAIAEYVLLF